MPSPPACFPTGIAVFLAACIVLSLRAERSKLREYLVCLFGLAIACKEKSVRGNDFAVFSCR